MKQNPCLTCDHHLLGGDKNDPRCLECRDRVNYWHQVNGWPTGQVPQQHRKENHMFEAQPTPTKVCSRPDCQHAGLPQPLDEFDNCKANKDGKSGACKECRRADQRVKRDQARAAKPEKKRRPKPVKTCHNQPEPAKDAPIAPEQAQPAPAKPAFVPASVPAQPLSRYAAAAARIGALVEEKQKAYGDSFGQAGAVLRVLYPNGVAPEQIDDMLCVVRIVDKLFRIATDKGALGENPYSDIAGYGLLGAVRDAAAKEAADA